MMSYSLGPFKRHQEGDEAAAVPQRNDEAPDPMGDPEGYALWCELHPYPMCEGTGEVMGGDEGIEHTCV